jgi:hypothetical protein
MTVLHAIVLRSTIARGGMVIAPSFTDTHGRISIALYTHGSNALTPFSLIEAELSRIDGDFALAKRVSVLDTYTQARQAPDGAKTLIYLRSILEHCLPQTAPAKAAWEVTTSLFSCLPSFKDWKTAPFLLATLFFEQEGISKESLLSSKISDQAKEIALQAFSLEKADWINLTIPDDLFQATFELVGIDIGKVAKGGT